MELLISDFAVVVVLGSLVLLRGRDAQVARHKTARWLLAAGLVPLAVLGGAFLLFGAGEVASGDWSGGAHLLSFVAILMLGLLSWRRPLEGGVMLFILVALNLIFYPDLPFLLLPHMVASLLLIAGALIARRTPPAPRPA